MKRQCKGEQARSRTHRRLPPSPGAVVTSPAASPSPVQQPLTLTTKRVAHDPSCTTWRDWRFAYVGFKLVALGPLFRSAEKEAVVGPVSVSRPTKSHLIRQLQPSLPGRCLSQPSPQRIRSVLASPHDVRSEAGRPGVVGQPERTEQCRRRRLAHRSVRWWWPSRHPSRRRHQRQSQNRIHSSWNRSCLQRQKGRHRSRVLSSALSRRTRDSKASPQSTTTQKVLQRYSRSR